MLFLLYLCTRNQMKTVKTLHFDFIFFGVSLSISFGYAHNQPTDVGHLCIFARVGAYIHIRVEAR